MEPPCMAIDQHNAMASIDGGSIFVKNCGGRLVYSGTHLGFVGQARHTSGLLHPPLLSPLEANCQAIPMGSSRNVVAC